LKNSSQSKLAQPITKKVLFGFLSKLVNEHGDVDNAILLFNEFKLRHMNLIPASGDFEFIFELLKDKEVPKEKIIEIFDKQPRPSVTTISCPVSVLQTVFEAFNEVGEGLEAPIKKRVLRYLRDQSLGKDDAIYQETKQRLTELESSEPAAAEEEAKEE